MMAWLMGVPGLSPAQLLQRLQQGDLSLIDVNSAPPRQGLIPGARWIDPTQLGPQDLPTNRDQTLVFYCANPFCRKAPRAARQARQWGHTDVAVLAAGIEGWQRAGLPLS